MMQNTISKNVGGLILILAVLSMISCGKKEPLAWELSDELTRLYKAKQYEEAKEVSRNFLESYPDDERAPSVQLQLVAIYYHLKDFNRAREEYEEVVQKYPLRSKKAQRQVDFIKEHSDFDYQPLKMYVDIQSTSDPQKRIKGLKEILKRYPDCNLADDVQYSIGRAHMLLRQYPEAKKEFDILLTKYPHSSRIAEYYFDIGKSYIRQKKIEEAIKVYRTLLNECPDSPLAPKAQWEIGEYYRRLKKYDIALAELQRVLDKYPDSIQAPMALLTIGNIYAHQKEKEKAKKAYQKVLTNYPNVYIPWVFELVDIPGKSARKVVTVKARVVAEEFLEDLEYSDRR
ncbi:tetratricopeptide repeat protein [bacterium]|nr:tetratricopeptide repeat protein [bacterium]